jgi:chromate reductase
LRSPHSLQHVLDRAFGLGKFLCIAGAQHHIRVGPVLKNGWPVNTLADSIRAADGVIFCTPEYNFSIPGGLKNAIDWVSRLQNQPFAGKPVALQSASPAPVGGARVQYDLRKAMMLLDAFTLNKSEIFIGNCASKFDEQTGELKDEVMRGFIQQQLASFATFIARVAPR